MPAFHEVGGTLLPQHLTVPRTAHPRECAPASIKAVPHFLVGYTYTALHRSLLSSRHHSNLACTAFPEARYVALSDVPASTCTYASCTKRIESIIINERALAFSNSRFAVVTRHSTPPTCGTDRSSRAEERQRAKQLARKHAKPAGRHRHCGVRVSTWRRASERSHDDMPQKVSPFVIEQHVTPPCSRL